MTTPADGADRLTTPDQLPDSPQATTLPDALGTDASGADRLRLPGKLLKMAERLSVLDGPAGQLSAAIERRLSPDVSSLLLGRWLGHPLHPILVTVPIGAWMSVPMLDIAGQPDAARRVLAFGILAAAPASATGLVEYTTLDSAQRRVAVTHVVANSLGITCLARSWSLRRRGAQASGSVWTLAGLTFAGVGGALGGHLSYSQGAGVHRQR
jgi:hypothetical protein